MDGERELRAALWMVEGISGRAIAAAGDLAEAVALPREELARRMGLRPHGRAALARAPADLRAWARAEEAALAARGGRFLLRGDPDYPELGRLPDPPELLTLRGSLGEAGTGRAVAVIGARRADPAAVALARSLGAALARAGHTVVSGGALGIDAAAHAGALDGGGATVAVLGSGLLDPHPAGNRRLFARMLESGGGLLSELPPRAPARAWHFPRRNRLVAALARALVVVRAGARSGCAHTVEAALRLGLPIWAVGGGGEENAGCRRWIEAGIARPIRDAADLLDGLGHGRRRELPADLAPAELRMLDALGGGPASLPAVAAAAGLSVAVAARLLAGLCARDLVRAAGPGRFAARTG